MTLSDELDVQRDRESLLAERRRLLDALLMVDCQLQEIDDLIPRAPKVTTIDASVADAMRSAS